ncbi:hypothetical protein [Malikia granosa]|uniref:hypothetical protein n=1 Tax=Malikia granosa TaxID=263067 RepID=UPI0011B00C9F|nr:hypothetical protein [Malikia granosa]
MANLAAAPAGHGIGPALERGLMDDLFSWRQIEINSSPAYNGNRRLKFRLTEKSGCFRKIMKLPI